MIESRRRAYLEVMGYDVWFARPPEPEGNRLVIGPGEGDTLLVCGSPAAAASPFAGDVARALGETVVWAWQDLEGRAESPTLEEAVGQYLFTRVVLFGAELVPRLCEGDAPLVLGSARILVTGRPEDLAADGAAKLAFWNLVSGNSPGS